MQAATWPDLTSGDVTNNWRENDPKESENKLNKDFEIEIFEEKSPTLHAKDPANKRKLTQNDIMSKQGSPSGSFQTAVDLQPDSVTQYNNLEHEHLYVKMNSVRTALSELSIRKKSHLKGTFSPYASTKRDLKAVSKHDIRKHDICSRQHLIQTGNFVCKGKCNSFDLSDFSIYEDMQPSRSQSHLGLFPVVSPLVSTDCPPPLPPRSPKLFCRKPQPSGKSLPWKELLPHPKFQEDNLVKSQTTETKESPCIKKNHFSEIVGESSMNLNEANLVVEEDDTQFDQIDKTLTNEHFMQYTKSQVLPTMENILYCDRQSILNLTGEQVYERGDRKGIHHTSSPSCKTEAGCSKDISDYKKDINTNITFLNSANENFEDNDSLNEQPNIKSSSLPNQGFKMEQRRTTKSKDDLENTICLSEVVEGEYSNMIVFQGKRENSVLIPHDKGEKDLYENLHGLNNSTKNEKFKKGDDNLEEDLYVVMSPEVLLDIKLAGREKPTLKRTGEYFCKGESNSFDSSDSCIYEEIIEIQSNRRHTHTGLFQIAGSSTSADCPPPLPPRSPKLFDIKPEFSGNSIPWKKLLPQPKFMNNSSDSFENDVFEEDPIYATVPLIDQSVISNSKSFLNAKDSTINKSSGVKAAIKENTTKNKLREPRYTSVDVLSCDIRRLKLVGNEHSEVDLHFSNCREMEETQNIRNYKNEGEQFKNNQLLTYETEITEKYYESKQTCSSFEHEHISCLLQDSSYDVTDKSVIGLIKPLKSLKKNINKIEKGAKLIDIQRSSRRRSTSVLRTTRTSANQSFESINEEI